MLAAVRAKRSGRREETINNRSGPTSCYHSLVWTQTDLESAYADFSVLACCGASHPGHR